MKIYTRTGDKGRTSLVGGTRVPKTHIRIEAYGTVDELNAHIGFLLSNLTDKRDVNFLQQVQDSLFVVGAHLATDIEKTAPKEGGVVTRSLVEMVEQEIDYIDTLLPPLQSFVLPSGTPAAAFCHVCRTICRRAERRILALAEQTDVSADLKAYINRLSDYLFVLSRKINIEAKKDEIFWNNRCK